jgi:hypothetical protein
MPGLVGMLLGDWNSQVILSDQKQNYFLGKKSPSKT